MIDDLEAIAEDYVGFQSYLDTIKNKNKRELAIVQYMMNRESKQGYSSQSPTGQSPKSTSKLSRE